MIILAIVASLICICNALPKAAEVSQISKKEIPHHHHTDLASKSSGNFYSDLRNREWVLKVVNHCAAADEQVCEP